MFIGVELAKVGGASPPPPTLLEVDLASQNKRLDPPSKLKVVEYKLISHLTFIFIRIMDKFVRREPKRARTQKPMTVYKNL